VTRLLRPAWLLGHLAMVVLVATFLVLGWWQIGRAAHGNALSFGYSLEWPFFAAFVVFIWQREVRAVLRAERAGPQSPAVPGSDRADRAAADLAVAGPAAGRAAADRAGTDHGVSRFDVAAAMARRAARDRGSPDVPPPVSSPISPHVPEHVPEHVPPQGEPNG
jgi:hypothetical protein